MVFRSPVLNSSRNTKASIIERLVARYGEDFKSPLARDLGVHVSTVRRIFNQRDDLPLVYVLAIEKLLSEGQYGQ